MTIPTIPRTPEALVDELFAQQLRETCGLGETELEAALAELRALDPRSLPPSAALLIAGLPRFIWRVARTYAEHTRLEGQLAESERRYRGVVESLHEVIYRADARGHFTYLNPAWEDITGHAVEKSIGTLSLEYVHFDDVPRASATLKAMFKGDLDEQRDEFRFRTRGGGYRWFEVYARRECDAAGRVIGFTGTLNDVTERRQARERLQEQLHFVQELFEAIPLPVYMKDVEGRYLRLNKAFEQLTGVPREDALGRTVFATMSPRDAAEQVRRDRDLLGFGGTQNYEMHLQTPLGEVRDALWRKAALKRPDGSVMGLIGTITDITDRKRWESALVQAKEAAEAANRAKSEFLANMSHEIRTPMNGVIGMTRLALDSDDPAEQRDYLRIVQSSAEALLSILNDILDFSKIEAGKLVVEHIPFDLRDTLVETLKGFAPTAHAKGLELACEVDPDVPHFAVGDPGRLRQIVVNLVGNAVKFTEHGRITLRAALGERSADEFELLFSVSDTGIGIPEDKLASIFDAFTQEDSSTTRRFGGTGLGLAICSRLVCLMGGEIRAESEQGKGSVFRFNLRFGEHDASRERQTGADERAPGAGEAQRPLDILLVEDHPVNQMLAERLLDRWGHRTAMAENGEEALTLLASRRFDVVLMDVQMPVMGGLEATRRWRAEEAAREFRGRTPIVAMTASAMPADRDACIAAGMDDYLPKPLDAARLSMILQRIGAARSAQPEGART
jgi:PAS domain S-box-containing protein